MNFSNDMDEEMIELNKPSRKKILYSISPALRNYLKQNGREKKIPVAYKDLLHFTYSTSLKDRHGNDSLWEKVMYDSNQWNFIREGLVELYAMLKTEGDLTFVKHLDVARVDFCTFGNSNPFRIRIVNKFNDNYDHYYIKIADASRIYGLELEDILSPNRIIFFTHQNTLVEEHIPGIPGDIFLEQVKNDLTVNKIRLAKEFVKFNERCFVRLLGDMRSYNFVVDITPDIEDYQYRIRAIDFDQQSYEGRKNLYLPQFFKENNEYVDLTIKHLNKESIAQYQTEERTLIAFRLATSKYKMKQLLDIMKNDTLSTTEKTDQLVNELSEYHQKPAILKCQTMGELLRIHMKQMLRKSLKLIPKLDTRR